VTPNEMRAVAMAEVPPSGTLDVTGYVEHTMGGELPNGTPNGLGGSDRFGASWFDGLKSAGPIAGLLFDTPREAHAFVAALKGEGTELWERKEARRRRIAEVEVAAAALEAEEHEQAKEAKKAARQQKRAGVASPVATEESGDGWSRQRPSREKRSATTGKRSGGRRLARRKA
jgi:hypothetical protein